MGSRKGKKYPVTEKMQAHLDKLHKQMKGHVPWNKGKKGSFSGERNPMYGKPAWNRGIPCSEEQKKQISERNKKRKHTPEELKKMSDFQKGRPKSEEHRRKIGESNKFPRPYITLLKKGIPRTEETKKKIGVKSKAWHKTHISPMKGTKKTPEQCQKISERQKGKWAGEKNPTWCGGHSLDPYPPTWIEDKKIIRKRDNYTCQICGYPGRSVHHMDYNKKNCDPKNLITLCRKDHMRTNSHRDDWQESLLAIVEEREWNNNNPYILEKQIC